MPRPADGSALKGETTLIEQAARISTAYAEPPDNDLWPHEITVSIRILLAIVAAWIVVATVAVGLFVALIKYLSLQH